MTHPLGIIRLGDDAVTRYFVRVFVLGAVYEYEVPSPRKAEQDVEHIKRKGYRHYEGNAVIEYRRVVDVTWVQRNE